MIAVSLRITSSATGSTRLNLMVNMNSFSELVALREFTSTFSHQVDSLCSTVISQYVDVNDH